MLLSSDDSDDVSASYQHELPVSEWHLDPTGLIEDHSRLEEAAENGNDRSVNAIADTDTIPLTVEVTAAVAEQPSVSRVLRMRRERTRTKRGLEKSKKESTISSKSGTARKRRSVVGPKSRKQKTIWEFLLHTIVNPVYNPRLIEWKDISIGEFRINKGQELANLWTKFKGHRTEIKYESFARGLRYYYKHDYIRKRDNKKLVYQFCDKTHWRKYIESHSSLEHQKRLGNLKTRRYKTSAAIASHSSQLVQQHRDGETGSDSGLTLSQKHNIDAETRSVSESNLAQKQPVDKIQSEVTSELVHKHFVGGIESELDPGTSVSRNITQETQSEHELTSQSEANRNIPQVVVEVENRLLAQKEQLEKIRLHQKERRQSYSNTSGTESVKSLQDTMNAVPSTSRIDSSSDSVEESSSTNGSEYDVSTSANVSENTVETSSHCSSEDNTD